MSSQTVELRSIQSFFVGGHAVDIQNTPVQMHRMVPNGAPRAVDQNGCYTAGQAYVQHYQLAHPKHAAPVLLWHGGGMTGAQWESTPDGRTGWLWFLLKQGFDVMVCDAAERGRASWLPNDPIASSSPPLLRSKRDAWQTFRIGSTNGYHESAASREAFAGQQFPVQAFDQFTKQFVPRWLGHEELETKAYLSMLKLVGPSIIIGHSQGAGYACRLAAHHPELVRAVVAIEGTGMPEAAEVASGLPSPVPHLAVWGDHIEHSPVWAQYRRHTTAYWAALAAHGQSADVLDLPRCNVHGNSHFPMADANSDDVASMVCNWLASTLKT